MAEVLPFIAYYFPQFPGDGVDQSLCGITADGHLSYKQNTAGHGIRPGINLLKQHRLPAIYVYYQFFLHHNIRKCTKGIICHLQLSDWSQHQVFPHEGVVDSFVQQQLDLLNASQIYFTPVHGLYQTFSGKVDAIMEEAILNPIIKYQDTEAATHVIAMVQDKKAIFEFVNLLKDVSVTLADGHHRYTAAWQRLQTNLMAPRYITAYLTNLTNNEVCLLPIHKMIENLFEFEEIKFIDVLKDFFELCVVEDVQTFLTKTLDAATFGLITERFSFIIRLNKTYQRQFDPALMSVGTYVETLLFKHILQLERIEDFIQYSTNLMECVNKAQEGKVNFALLNCTLDVNTVVGMAGKGIIFPEKTTYFYPKIPRGLIISKATESATDKLTCF